MAMIIFLFMNLPLSYYLEHLVLCVVVIILGVLAGKNSLQE